MTDRYISFIRLFVWLKFISKRAALCPFLCLSCLCESLEEDERKSKLK